MPIPKRAMALAVAGALVALTLAACATGGGAPTAGGNPKAAPTFYLATLTGTRVTNQTLKGKPALITFYASW